MKKQIKKTSAKGFFYYSFVGMVFGVLAALGLIWQNPGYDNKAVAYESWWNNFLASADRDSFDWRDVFNPFGTSERGGDLYNLIYKKLNRSAEKSALKDTANNFGLNTQEATAILDGSVSVLLNQRNVDTNTSQGEAVKIIADLQSNYADLYDLYQIQQEIDVTVANSELFANGDLSDSGFDLVYDLSKIEEILFVESTDSTLGQDFKGAYDSPYNPVDPLVQDDFYVDSPAPDGLLETGGITTPGGAVEVPDDGFFETVETGLTAESEDEIRAAETVPEVLPSDVCADLTASTFTAALDSFGEQNAALDSNDAGGDGAVAGDEAGGSGSDDADDDGDGGDDGDDGFDNSGSDLVLVKPAAKGDWLKVWCPGMPDPSSPLFAGVAAAGLKSVSGANPTLAFTGASAGVSTGAFAAKASVCFNVELIKKRVSSYQPGDSCIACEVAQINELLNKTISHSLVPSKVSGNLLESTKYKSAGALLNFQFVTIWNPVPTPSNDEAIFGNNVFEEWNKFADRYQPLLIGDLQYETSDGPTQSDNYLLELETLSAPDNLGQADLFKRLQKTRDKYKAKAAFDVEQFDLGNDLTNQLTYSQEVLKEVKQMNALFKNFRGTFDKINTEALDYIVNKPNLD
ncbi:MAG: hypothetical protein AAB373_00010 [Patescibacteria group bacterium]|mgnify:CR=1 FL=1